MQPELTSALAAVLFAFSTSILPAREVLPVDPGLRPNYVRRVLPLPREISFTHTVRLAPSEIGTRANLPDSPVAVQALSELRQALHVAGDAKAGSDAFQVVLELGGQGSAVLRSLKNSAQAYRIVPAAEDRGVVITALEPPGLLYAVKTLAQLIRPAPGSQLIEIPLVTVLDWPEIADRGVWGVDAFDCLPWLADRKFNHVEQISAVQVDPDTKKATARPKPGHEPLLSLGPKLAIQYVPVVLHLEQLESKGVFEAYPNLRAKGAGKEGAVCYSQPEFVRVLADWLVDLSRLRHVREVDVWMAENLAGKGGCKCAECSKTDRSLLELKTILAAWDLAQKKSSPFGLRVLTSEETYPSHKVLLPALPPSVKLWYYHSLRTYNTRKEPIIPRDVVALAKAGHWVGVCPNVVAHVGFPEPFSSGPFVHYRVQEFVNKQLQGIIAYPSPRVRYARYNMEALAEWTWNPNGRSPHEFALAFATREGLADPEKFADWTELHGPLSWDVYGSDWPAGEQRRVPGPVAELLLSGKLPAFGESKWGLYSCPWGQIKSADHLQQLLNDSTKSVQLARETGSEEFLQESLVLDGYLKALDALAKLKTLVKDGVIVPGQDAAAREAFDRYANALGQARTALAAWDRSVAGTENANLIGKPSLKLEEMQKQMRATSTRLLDASR